MGQDDDGERIARLEEQMKNVQADVASLKRMIFGGATLIAVTLWNKLAAILGFGPQ